MRFKKGDKVRMIWKPRFGFIGGKSATGTVVGINAVGYENPKMMVYLKNGDYIIQDIEEASESWVTFQNESNFTGS